MDIPVVMTRRQLRALYPEDQARQRAAEIADTVNWISGLMIDAATAGKLQCSVSVLATPVLARDRRSVIEELMYRFPDTTFWISSSAAYLLIDWS
jgi:hypothetical protein